MRSVRLKIGEWNRRCVDYWITDFVAFGAAYRPRHGLCQRNVDDLHGWRRYVCLSRYALSSGSVAPYINAFLQKILIFMLDTESCDFFCFVVIFDFKNRSSQYELAGLFQPGFPLLHEFFYVHERLVSDCYFVWLFFRWNVSICFCFFLKKNHSCWFLDFFL